MGRLLLVAAGALALAGCPRGPDPVDGGVDSGMPALAPCLERPDGFAKPPSGQLPCELLPPGFKP